MAYFLAIDSGGTKADYVLADETRALARVRSGTIKRMRTDAESARQNLEAALGELAALSGVPMDQIAYTCIGTAGETVPLVADWLHEALAARVGGGLLLLGDVEIALDAAFPGGPGVLALAGTGSNVAGRAPNGFLSTAGGWGPALADQGSGHRIGHQALRGIFFGLDQDRSTTLLPAVLEFWQLRSVEALIEHANKIPSPDFSRLTHLVLRCAEAGDAIAQGVLRQEGEDLALLVHLLIQRLRLRCGDPAFVPRLALAGSILEKVAPVREALVAAVQRDYPAAEALEGVVDPIEGALWRARQMRR